MPVDPTTEDFFGIDVERQHPTVMREFAHWMQVTSSLWVMPRAKDREEESLGKGDVA